MVSMIPILALLAAPNVPLLLFLCRKLDIRDFGRIFALEWGLYVLNALLVSGVLIGLDYEGNPLETLRGIVMIALIGMAMFAIPFAVLFYFLARWVERRLAVG